MIEVARLVVDTTFADRSEISDAYIGIHVQVGPVAFPDDDWPDYAPVVLGRWAAAAYELHTSKVQEVEVRFLAGPYLVRVARREDGLWQLTLVEDFLTQRTRHEAVVDPEPLIHSIVTASEATLELCADRGWARRDSRRLRRLLRIVRELEVG
jgi:hypothetical protein